MSHRIEDLLPHRPPFLWVDRILSLEPGVRCVASKQIGDEAELFAGHFPGNPILPGIYLIEAAAQTSGLMIGAARGGAASEALLAGVQRFKFLKIVRPGDLVEIDARAVTEALGMAVVSVELRVRGEIVAKGELSLVSR